MTNNIAGINQNITGGTSTESTFADIRQFIDNYAVIQQVGHAQYAWLNQEYNSVGTVSQVGSLNASGNYVGGKFNYTLVTQDGNQNVANIRMLHDYNGTPGDPLMIYQTGDRNLAGIWSGWATLSNGNHALLKQAGSDNKTTLNQEDGSFNSAIIYQYSNENVTNLNQAGSYLVASVNQYGDRKNVVNLNQTNGIVNIDQNGGSNVVEGL